jgi:hypothetical protein
MFDRPNLAAIALGLTTIESCFAPARALVSARLDQVLSSRHPRNATCSEHHRSGSKAVGSHHNSLAILLAVGFLGLAALAPTAASACGRLAPGAEVSGPVERGAASPQSAQVQPVIVPHCNLTPTADGAAVSVSPGTPDDSNESSLGRRSGRGTGAM